MVKLDKIYTKGGDKGQTSLGDGKRCSKNSLRVDAFGTIDEANAIIGIIRLHVDSGLDQILSHIQNDMFDLGADLCTPEDGRKGDGALRINDNQVIILENVIDKYNDNLAPLTSFILPAGTVAAVNMHHARTVIRRAERLVVGLSKIEKINSAAIKYLNRLSDLMFVLSRHCNNNGKDDILWVAGANR